MADEKIKIIQAGMQIYERGLVAGTWGNISRRLEEDQGQFVITPSGMDYREIREEDISVLNLEGKKLEGEKEPSIESPLHRYIYQSRKDTNAIIHTHSTFASAISCLREDIPPIVEDMVQIIGGSVETADYELPGTKELAESAIEALDDKKAALLANHGAVALGENLKEALKVAEITEKSAEIYLIANTVGEPQKFSEEKIEEMREAYKKYKQT